MNDTLKALFASRKFVSGVLALAAVFSAVLLRALDKIPADALVPTIASITTVAFGFISAVAKEDAAVKTMVVVASPGETQDASVKGGPVANDPTERAR